jgi:hypothetical protein
LQKNINGEEISYWKGNKIWLYGDIATEKFTLDLNWYTLTVATWNAAINVVWKQLILNDSSTDKSWRITSSFDQVFSLSNSAALEVNAWTIETVWDYAVVVWDKSWLKVNWWTLSAKWPAISWNGSWCPNGSCTYWDTDMQIKWWRVLSSGDYAIYHPSTAGLTIKW